MPSCKASPIWPIPCTEWHAPRNARDTAIAKVFIECELKGYVGSSSWKKTSLLYVRASNPMLKYATIAKSWLIFTTKQSIQQAIWNSYPEPLVYANAAYEMQYLRHPSYCMESCTSSLYTCFYALELSLVYLAHLRMSVLGIIKGNVQLNNHDVNGLSKVYGSSRLGWLDDRAHVRD